MSEEVWGIDFDQVESKRGGLLPPGVYKFVLDRAERQLNSNNKPYVGCWCKVVDAEDEALIGRVFYESKYLSDAAIPYTKAFFEDIGAEHCLAPNMGPKAAEGTLFQAKVVHKTTTRDGATNTEAQLQEIEALGSEDEPAASEPEEKVEEKPQRTSRRRR